MTDMQLPAHIAARMGRRNLNESAVSGLSTGNVPHISIRQNRFRLVDAGGNEKLLETFHLDCVVMDASEFISKIYYDKAFDPSAQDYGPPACFSDNGIGASSQAVSPQSASCATCPHNAWGSSTSRMTGKQTKACNDVKKIAVHVPGWDIPFLLRIPPASLKNWRSYLQALGAAVDVSMVVTRLEFDQQTQGVLTFKPVAYADEPALATIDQMLEAKRTDALVGRNDKPVQGALPAPATPPAATLPPPVQAAPPPPPPPAQVTTLQFPQQVPQQQGVFSTGAPALGIPAPMRMGQAQPAPAEAPKKPRGRPAKPIPQHQEAAAPAQQAPFMPQAAPPQSFSTAAPSSPPVSAPPTPERPVDLPAFLQPPGAPAPAPQTPVYGMAQGTPPDPAMQAALEAAFRLPT